MRTTEARVLVNFDDASDRFLPEGPRAITAFDRAALVWVNIQTGASATRGALHLRFWDTGERRRYVVPARPGFVFPTDAPNTVLLGMEKAIGTLNLATGLWTPFATIPDTNPRTIINDGEIVPGGRAIVFGTKDTKFEDTLAHLYLFTFKDHNLSPLAGGQICSNGKVFTRSDSGLTLYDIDTPTKQIRRYALNLDRREITPQGTAIDLTGEDAFPDGMCDAGDGSVIIAFFNPHRGGTGVARRYHLETGAAVEEWTTPGSPRVTCPCLVRKPEGVQLVLTTADEGMSEEIRRDSPNAGNLFQADTRCAHAPEPEIVQL